MTAKQKPTRKRCTCDRREPTSMHYHDCPVALANPDLVTKRRWN